MAVVDLSLDVVDSDEVSSPRLTTEVDEVTGVREVRDGDGQLFAVKLASAPSRGVVPKACFLLLREDCVDELDCKVLLV